MKSKLCRSAMVALIGLAPVLTGRAYGQTLREFTGSLDTKLSPDMVHVYQRVYTMVKNPGSLPIDPKPESGSVISVGELIDIRSSDGKTAVLLIEPPTGEPFVVVDANRNGKFEANERTILTKKAGMPGVTGLVPLPLTNVRYKDFPVYFGFYKGLHIPQLKDSDRLIEQSVYALAYGSANIGTRGVLLQYPFASGKASISTTDGLFGLDVNGDGAILDQQFSVESQSVSGEEAIFPLGDTFISTTAIDLQTGSIRLRERRKEEYTRVDLAVGREMPDFTFVDLKNKERKLSDFRGKYVLVDFWGAWCGDCTRETPFHLAAYERFQRRGLEIIGVDSDQKIEAARAYVAQNKIPWVVATHDSTKDLQDKVYKLQEYPSTILLGPDGKVLVLDQHKLQGDALLQTLDQLLRR